MRAILYADLTDRILSTTLGGSALTWPTLVQGDTLALGFRLVERRDGEPALSSRVVQGIKVTIGKRDARPTLGTIRFQIGNPATSQVEGTNLTTALAYNFTAADLQTALNALSAKPATATVVAVDNSFLVTFAGQTAYTTLTGRSNRLRPISRANFLQYTLDGDYITEIRLMQTPAAFADTFEAVLPPMPTIAEVLAGGENSGVKWDEIQKVIIPPTFAGSFVLKRDYKTTDPMTVADTAETIAEKLNAALADEGEVFEVSKVEGQNAALIRWTGDLSGTDQALLELEVFDAPAGDPTTHIQLNRAEMAAAIRTVTGTLAGEITLPLEVELSLENEIDDELTDIVSFVVDVKIKAEVTLPEMASPANIDFLRPPSPISYRPRGAGQINSGVLHWSGPKGDGSATVFAVDHDLATDIAFPMVRRNVTDGELLRPGVDYGVGYDNDNSLTLTMLGDWVTTPADTNELIVAVLGMAQASQYDEHTHSIAEVDGLQTELDALGAAVALLNASAAVQSGGTRDAAAGSVIMEQVFRLFAEAYPGNVGLDPAIKSISEIDQSTLGGDNNLLGAIHDAEAAALPGTLPTPSTTRGNVYQNRGLTEVKIPGGGGRSSYKLQPGEFVASDGRKLFPVIAPGVHNGAIEYTVNTTTNTLSFPDFTLANGTELFFISTTTKPAGLSNTLYVINSAAGSCKVSATLGGSEIDITDTGTGTHYLFAYIGTATSWFPRDFERELFVAHVGANQLLVKKTLEAKVGVEVAILSVNTPAARHSQKITQGRWRVVLEIGVGVSEASPATTKSNLKKIAWQTVPILDELIHLTRDAAAVHTFGVRIKRTAADAWTVEKNLYGFWYESDATLAVGDFYLRGRLTEFDIEDFSTVGIPDPEGLVVLLGPDKTNAGDASNMGRLVIK